MDNIAHNEIFVTYINGKDLVLNKDKIIMLLNENLKLNFPFLGDISKYAVASYEDMVQYQLNNSAILIGAFKDEHIIGFLWAYRRNLLGEARMHLSHIVIDSNFRALGIGSKLLKKLEDITLEEGIHKIELMASQDNINTMHFYKKHEYIPMRVQLEKELGKSDDN